jgi:hypothetical protein
MNKILKLSSILVVLFFLSGCPATVPSIKTNDVIVKVPVPVPCRITPIKKPEMPVDTLAKGDTLHTKAKTLASELERREAYEKELVAAIGSCQ